MTPLILSAAYKRNDLFKQFIKHLPYQKVIIGDKENEQNLDNGVYLIHENKPLGKKWNYGLQFCKSIKFDYLIITGSDDFFCPNLWAFYKDLSVHYFGLLDLYFVDGLRVKYCPGFKLNRFGEPHGAGRAIHRSVLEALNWKLWDDEINIGLDASMTEKLNQLEMQTKFIKIKDYGFYAADIKSSDNLHSISEYDGTWCDHDEKGMVFKSLGL